MEWQKSGDMWERERIYFAAEEVKAANNLLKANHLQSLNPDLIYILPRRQVKDLQIINNSKNHLSLSQKSFQIQTTKTTKVGAFTRGRGRGAGDKKNKQNRQRMEHEDWYEVCT